jgi:hypothetical protein
MNLHEITKQSAINISLPPLPLKESTLMPEKKDQKEQRNKSDFHSYVKLIHSISTFWRLVIAHIESLLENLRSSASICVQYPATLKLKTARFV